jgi:octaprenyl-diphosphate synthase
MNPLIKPQMALLETRLRQLVQSEVEFIELIGEDLLDAGGKRARPQLVFLAAKALESQDPRLVDFAAVIELLHSASLLHDDLIDDADTRRGKETAFSAFKAYDHACRFWQPKCRVCALNWQHLAHDL